MAIWAEPCGEIYMCVPYMGVPVKSIVLTGRANGDCLGFSCLDLR